MTSSPRRSLRIAVSTAGVLLLLFLVIELGARVLSGVFANPELNTVIQHYRLYSELTIRYEPDPLLDYRLKPNYTVISEDGGITRHNAQGFRNSDDFGEKVPGIFRIVCLGASTTYGTGVADNDDTYPARLERWLSQRVGELGWDGVEVFNLGVGGYTSYEVLRNLEEYGIALRPDMILLQSGINDVAPRFFPDFDCAYSSYRKPMKPISDSALSRALRTSRAIMILGWTAGVYEPLTLQARTRQPLPRPDAALERLGANGTECYEEHIREAIRLAQSAGARVVLLTQPYLALGGTVTDGGLEGGYQRGLEEHNAVLEQIGLTTDATLIDLANTTPMAREYFADPIHMTAQGNAKKAELIGQGILELIRKAQ